MNNLLIEPNLTLDYAKLNQALIHLSRSARLDINIQRFSKPDELATILIENLRKHPDTIIALGSYRWFDKIISECCHVATLQNTEPPLFAHILPPKLYSTTWRIPAYMEQSLKRSVSFIAARKIIQKKAFVCSQKIWFSHTLRIQAQQSSQAPTKFLARTPGGGKLKIEAPAEKIELSIQESLTDSDSQIVSVLASRIASNRILRTSKLGIDHPLKSKTNPLSSEDTFHIQASQIEIQAPFNYECPDYDQKLTTKVTIKPASFTIRIITEKNDILKY
jgi:hypothetical protein